MNEVQTSKRDVKTLLQSQTVIAQLQRVATKYLPADRLARLLLTAVNKTPGLLNCTPESVLQAGMTCSQLGLEPDGRHAHLIPYSNTCQFIIDYKGLLLLARRNGIEALVADLICENDEFIYFRDETGTHFRHVPKFGGRGKAIGAYSTCKIDGAFDVEVMTADEIESIRNRSRAGKNGPWVTDWNEMAKKTVIRRHSKRWPLLAEVAEAIVAGDDDTLEGTPHQKVEVKSPNFLERTATEVVATTESATEVVVDPPKRGPGRPRKIQSPVQAETTKEVEGTSEQPEPEPPLTEPPVHKPNFVRGLTGLLKLAGISEADFLQYLREKALIDDSISSIQEMATVAQTTLEEVYNGWDAHQFALQDWKEGQ